jgi:hypothetical protein
MTAEEPPRQFVCAVCFAELLIEECEVIDGMRTDVCIFCAAADRADIRALMEDE